LLFAVCCLLFAVSTNNAFIVGDFLWANRQYSSIAVAMDVNTFNLSPMGVGIAATSPKKQLVTVLENGNAIVGGVFSLMYVGADSLSLSLLFSTRLLSV
jgi:hypothetical protein